MIDLYYWGTPNGHKITIALEEMELDYQIFPINIMENDQFQPDFLRISPNNKIPAIVDQNGPHHHAISIFESGAILQYLGRKTGLFYPTDEAERVHFSKFAQEKVPYAIERYVNETKRLYGVLNQQLIGQKYVAGAYSIADMAILPWLLRHEWQQIELGDYPYVKEYIERLTARPAVQRALAIKV